MLGYFLCAIGFLANAIAAYRIGVRLAELKKLIQDTDLYGLYPKRISRIETEVGHTLDGVNKLKRLCHDTYAEVLKVQRMLTPSSLEEKS